MALNNNRIMILHVVLRLLTLSLLGETSIEGSECLSNLKNIAVYEGQRNIIMNLTPDSNNVRWTIIPTSDEFGSYPISDYGGYRDPSLTGLFYLNESGLVILNATTAPNGEGPISTSGLYIAQCENNDNKTGAKLLVVRDSPECSCNASSPNAIQLSCSIIYADVSLHPINANMIWKIGDVIYTTDTPPRARVDYYVFESISKITVDSSIPENYTCTVAFNAPTDIIYDFVATNSPEFIASCSVEVCGLETTAATQPPTTLTSTTSTIPAGDCLESLKNTAVYEGDENTVMGLTADPNNVKWTIIPTSDEFGSYQISDYDGERDPSLAGLFYPDQSGLVILNATTAPNREGPISTSGLYIAQCSNDGNRTAAKLLVVRKSPECSCATSSPNAARLSCSIFYADATLHPIYANMTWTAGDVIYTTDTPSRTRIDYYVFESTSTITVDNSIPKNFTCTVAFNAPTYVEYDFVATNAPEFSASCSVEVCGLAITNNEATTSTQPPATLTSTTPSGDCIQNLKNTAVYEGDENTVMSLTADPNNVKWNIIPSSDEFGSYQISDYDGERDPSLAGLFDPDQSGLLIFNATTAPNGKGPISTSGLYIAQCSNNGNRTAAKLLVVHKSPECSCATTSPNAAQLSCSIFYADATLHPIYANMTWKISDVIHTTDTPSRTRFDYHVFQSTSTITVDNSVPRNFTCIIAFNAPTDIVYDFIATNAPEFSASCSVEVCGLVTTSNGTTSTQPSTTLTSTAPTGDCLENLKNTAVYEGDENIMMSLTADPNNVKWTIIPSSDEFGSYTISDYDGYRDLSLVGLFYPDQNGLLILNAATAPNGEGPISTSGLYIAQCSNDGNRTAAKLLVVRKSPECSCATSSPNAVQLSCSIFYADATLHSINPNMTWKIGDVLHTTATPERTRVDYYVFESTSTITVDNSVPRNFTCNVAFNEPTDIVYDFIATNAPEFSASCSVEVCDLATTTQPPSTEQPTTAPGYCFPNMMNTAVREGTLDVQMNVIASPCGVTLSVVPTSDEFGGDDIIGPDCLVDSTLEGLYSVNESGLIILNSTTTENGQPISTSGLYIANCNDNSGDRTGAKLVVIRSGPTCSCVNEGDNIQLTCNADFADCTIHPIPAIMTWIINGAYYATDTPAKNKTDAYIYTVTSIITLDANTVYDYQCVLTFGEPTDIQYDWIASNAPAFNESCSTYC